MDRDAKEGVIVISGDESKTSLIEVNCETDFVAKNEDFVSFVKELSELNNTCSSDVTKLNSTKMSNGKDVKDNLVEMIAKLVKKLLLEKQKLLKIPILKIIFISIL